MTDIKIGVPMTRRQAIELAAAFGAALAWPSAITRRSGGPWRKRRDLYPQGVASGDPHADSVIVWTRRPPSPRSTASRLLVEIAADPKFRRVVATAHADISADSDWTCRILAAGLAPGREYWYRFTDEHGFGSRIGRTLTAPAATDDRPIQFAFVSCQNVQQGACNAYRRMIWEDERRAPADRLGFVLHLGDFIYEMVWYPEDRPKGMYDRKLRDIVRYANGERHRDFHVPTTVDDYRAVYRAYLLDPELQDARARWPFVCVWDNHEFSWRGWQSQQNFGDGARGAQTRKTAANQVWFEYQPARVVKPGDPSLARFRAPSVRDTPLRDFDEQGLGLDPGNIAAIESLRIFRTLRWGRNVDLILTDNRSYRSEPVMERPEADAFGAKQVPWFVSEAVVDVLDAGRAYAGGNPPEAIRHDGADLPNPRKDSPPQTMLGATQKAWFLHRLRASAAPWKLWGNSVGMLDWRTDLQNLPPELAAAWTAATYGQMADDDWSAYRTERAEIFDFIRREGITGVATIVGDRHSFNAGLLSASLPPKPFEPVGVEFITGSVSAPGLFEAARHAIPMDHPLRALYLYDPPGGLAPKCAANVSLMHGVRASLALQSTHDAKEVLASRNPDVAPHLAFVDGGGHGYGVVRAAASELAVEFVCIPQPTERIDRADGGPLAYRIGHRVKLWVRGEAPRLERTTMEGEMPVILADPV